MTHICIGYMGRISFLVIQECEDEYQIIYIRNVKEWRRLCIFFFWSQESLNFTLHDSKEYWTSRDIDFTLIVFSVQTHPCWRERIAISLNRIVRTYIFRDLVAIIAIIPLNLSIYRFTQDPLKSRRF